MHSPFAAEALPPSSTPHTHTSQALSPIWEVGAGPPPPPVKPCSLPLQAVLSTALSPMAPVAESVRFTREETDTHLPHE